MEKQNRRGRYIFGCVVIGGIGRCWLGVFFSVELVVVGGGSGDFFRLCRRSVERGKGFPKMRGNRVWFGDLR